MSMAVAPQIALARSAAKDLLSELAKRMQIEIGRPPSAEEFYPVHLERIVEDILMWKLDFVSGLGFGLGAGLGTTIRGKCIFEDKKILVDSTQSDVQRRFSLAHEIGHAVLHDFSHGCSGDSSIMNRSVRDWGRPQGERENKAEREADIFAAQLLMPEKAVSSRFHRIVGSPRLWLYAPEAKSFCDCSSAEAPLVTLANSLASHKGMNGMSLAEFFGVSVSAMSRRLRELGLVFD